MVNHIAAVDRAEQQAELDAIADQLILPRAFNLIHQLVGPSVVKIVLQQDRCSP